MVANLLLLGAVLMQAPADSARTMAAHRLAPGEQAPVVDGRLNDAAWAAAPVASDFVQQRPNPGAAASQRTEVRIAYDDDAVYVGVRAFDSAPDSIAAQMGRRDVSGIFTDWVQVVFDSYHDRRTGYRFAVTPRGVKKDVFHYDDGPEDVSWDAVWTAETTIDSAGWSAEFRIPFSQLRFRTGAGEQTWGLNVIRDIARTEERSYWSPMPPDRPGFASKFGTLTGMRDLRSPQRLELLPYTVARVTRDGQVSDDDPFRSPTDPGLSFGADLKYGLTSNLTLTATFNPDFGQVEADPSQVNLGAFETYFSERRPFFVEGVDVFNFGIGGPESLFYSRRIGRSPQGGVGGEMRFVDAPAATTILGAAKLTGRTSGGWTVGILDAVTAEEKTRYVVDDVDEVGRTVSEPMTNYGVARVRRDFRRGQSSIGGIVTTVHRNLDGDAEGLQWLPSSAYAGGLDARHRFAGNRWEAAAFVLHSTVQGDTMAIQRLQLSPARYYQRPDAEHLSYRSDLTSLSGTAAAVAVNKISGRWQGGADAQYRSPGFEVNDLGFQQSADEAETSGYLGYSRQEPQGPFRNYNVFTNFWSGWTTDRDHTGAGGNINGSFQLTNLWGGFWGISHNTPGLSVSGLRGGPALATLGTSGFWFGFDSDTRKRVRYGLLVDSYSHNGADGHSTFIRPYMVVRPSSRLDLSMQPSIHLNNSPAQYVRTRSDLNAGGETRWLFARLDQTTATLTARLNYIFSPNLSLQLYAEPFISAGRYDRFMEVDDPRSREFGDRFAPIAEGELRTCEDAEGNTFYGVRPQGEGCGDEAGFSYTVGNPDFNVRSFNSNAVLRWEYRPGSSLFVVWSQGRSEFVPDGRFRLRDNTADLFRAPGTNVLLIKMSWWLDF